MENIAANANVKIEIVKSPHKSPTIEKTYQKKTPLEHILLRPDTYIGSVEVEEDKIWVFDDATNKMKQRMTKFVPGLYKIFDEILVNAADNKIRDKTMNTLKVDINKEEGSIRVLNNGRGIPVVMHKEHKMYVPELIFGHLLTSSNYDDRKKKTVGGRNGYGAKLANIFSTEFIVETVDAKSGLKFYQKYSNNMGKRSKPKTTKAGKTKDYTQITFKPDFPKFGMEGFDDDIIALMKKRVHDIAGIYGKGLKVSLNGVVLKIKNFKDYIQMYISDGTAFVHEKVNDRWEVAIAASDGHFQQVSFVNSIATIKGGKHVNYLTDQIGKSLVAYVKKKNKKVSLKPHHIKNHLWVFVNSLIENPAFDSQTKNTLTTTKSKFGSTCALSDKFMKRVAESGVIESVLAWAEYKQAKDMKKGDGKRRGRLTGIPKLEDANNAGKKGKSKDCTLILTEGDSAKALAVAGFSIVGRQNYGVFPLKGKLLNVREASVTQMMNNKEISSLKQIIGLQHGKVYEKTDSLRYGHVMIMTDQDHDGSHIKGLLINFFEFFWPSLLKIDGFLNEFITPIVKATKGKSKNAIVKSFYTLPEYETWKEENNNAKGWNIKYYKGLGTSTGKEAKQYFTDLEKHQIDFEPLDADDRESVKLAFGKTMADSRKAWMNAFVPGTFLDQNVDSVKYTDFFNKELILFSRANNVRALPSVVDGLKPGQRKILFSCFKRKLYKEAKVAQLVGYVSEHSAYHHGEMSLTGSIINLAQNYPGSNNVNYLYPGGQFGTRAAGGKDHASARYIFTKISSVTRSIFPEADDPVLNFLDDDGVMVEPEWYVPIIPTVLLNGTQGIGTGWSTSIPCYNPRDLVKSVKQLLDNDGTHVDNIVPWTAGWIGKMTPSNPERTKYITEGIIEKVNDTTLLIKELPLQKWTSDYRTKVLDKLLDANKIQEFQNNCTDVDIEFKVTMEPDKLLLAEAEGFINFFKLSGHCNLTNMQVFNPDGLSGAGNIKQYHNVEDIIKRFYGIRLHFYDLRKKYLTAKLIRELNMLEDRVRFILAVIAEELEIRNRPKAEILHQLARDGYRPFRKEKKKSAKQDEDEDDEEEDNAEDEFEIQKLSKDYNYLLSMALWCLTMEKVDKLKEETKNKEAELDKLCNTTIQQLWHTDLDSFLDELDKFEEHRTKMMSDDGMKKKRQKKQKKKKVEDDDEFIPGGRSKPKKRKPRKQKVKKEIIPIKVEESLAKEIKDIVISDVSSDDIPILGKKKLKKASLFEGSDEDVDLLPEDSDDELGLSKINGLANEMHNSLTVTASPFLEAKLTPKKKGAQKRKKQVTPLVATKKAPTKKAATRKPRKQKVAKVETKLFTDESQVKQKKATGRGRKKKVEKKTAPKKSRAKKKDASSEEDNWEQEKLPPLQQWREELPVAPRSTKRPSRRRKVISYADFEDEFDDFQ